MARFDHVKPDQPGPWRGRRVRRPVAFWTLDDRAAKVGDRAREAVGELHGVYAGSQSLVGVFGPSGVETRFTSAWDQYVALGTAARLDLTGSATVATSYRLATVPTSPSAFQLYSRDSAAGRGIVLELNNNTTAPYKGICFYFNGGGVSTNADGATVNLIAENVAPTANQDRSVVCTYRKVDGRFSMWIDGVLVRRFFGTTAGAPSAPAVASMIGRRAYSGFTQPFDGIIRYMGVWDAELTDDEVTRVFADPFAELRERRRPVLAPRPPFPAAWATQANPNPIGAV